MAYTLEEIFGDKKSIIFETVFISSSKEKKRLVTKTVLHRNGETEVYFVISSYDKTVLPIRTYNLKTAVEKYNNFKG